ncbi:MAG TPA: hemerythrin family protein [Lachnospiraceae bacterium]|nr:hemerythrin family protein [Lachnospiraceae bacterium]
MYELKSQYLTGMEMIDNHHRRIFKLADEAYQLLKDENMLFKDEKLLNIVKGLQDYTKYHFAEEETYMESIHYLDLDSQKNQHQGFIEELDKLNQEMDQISLGNQDELILKILNYLTSWLQNHIEISDMLIK